MDVVVILMRGFILATNANDFVKAWPGRARQVLHLNENGDAHWEGGMRKIETLKGYSSCFYLRMYKIKVEKKLFHAIS